MVPRVYIETTIPSFYFEVRSEPDMVARRDWTRDWWDSHRSQFELYTSEAVIDELERGDFESKTEALNLISELPLLPFEQATADIVNTYISPLASQRSGRCLTYLIL